MPGRVFGGTHTSLEQVGASTSLRTAPCRDPSQVPGVAREAQLIIWGLMKDVLSV